MAKNTSKKTPASKNTTPKKIPKPRATAKPKAVRKVVGPAVLIPQLQVIPDSFQPADIRIDDDNPASTRTVDEGPLLSRNYPFDRPASSWTKVEWDAATQDTKAVAPPLFYEVTPAVKIVGYSLLVIVAAVAVWWGVQ